MTSITPENLRAELHRAAGVVAGIAAKLTEQDIKAPSELPGWSRGHVLAHICGIANAMGRQLEYAARGEGVELYDGGFEGRNRAIEMAAGHSLAAAPGRPRRSVGPGPARLRLPRRGRLA